MIFKNVLINSFLGKQKNSVTENQFILEYRIYIDLR